VKHWNKSRCRELGILQRLLREASYINSGNYALERIRGVIRMAERLDRSSLNRHRSSFMQFLIEEAAKEASDGKA
jgi:hypothetical protein